MHSIGAAVRHFILIGFTAKGCSPDIFASIRARLCRVVSGTCSNQRAFSMNFSGLVKALSLSLSVLVSALPLGGCASFDALQATTSMVARAGKEAVGIYDYALVHSQRTTQGYTVEGGNLIDRNKQLVKGSLVMVLDPAGALTAIIDRPDEVGVLYVDAKGKRILKQSPADMNRSPDPDAKPERAEAIGSGQQQVATVDALVLFTAKALSKLEGDPVAYALAELETANLGLRNSELPGIQLRLVGITVTDTDHVVDAAGLNAIRDLMTPLREDYFHDINVAFSGTLFQGGLAHVRQWSSINGVEAPLAFRHEVGHNAGGQHCYTGELEYYFHGYQTANGAHTFMCGNNVPYYSNPQVMYDGQALGDPSTADMARVWRESANRLSNYSPAFEGLRGFYYSPLGHEPLIVEGIHSREGAFVALSEEVGPTQVVDQAPAGTPLQVRLVHDGDGKVFTVKMTASRRMGPACTWTGMHAIGSDCEGRLPRLELSLQADASQNPGLPAGWYNGILPLQVVSKSFEGSASPMRVSIALKL